MKSNAEKPDISSWRILAAEDAAKAYEKACLDTASEALRYALEDDETYLYFPVMWAWCDSDGLSGKAVEDPLMLYLCLALGDELHPSYQVSLAKLVDDFLEGVKTEAGEIAHEHIPDITKLRDGLQGLADKLSKAMEGDKQSPSQAKESPGREIPSGA